jgi:hypothetical protein
MEGKETHILATGDHNQGPVENDLETHAEAAQEISRPSGIVQIEEATFDIISVSRGFAAPTR